MSKPKEIMDQLGARLFWAEKCIAAYRTALDSLGAVPDSEAALLLKQIDRRYPEFNPKTHHEKQNSKKA